VTTRTPLGASATYLTVGSLSGLAAGLALGVLAHGTANPSLASLATAVRPLGDAWTSALLMVVLPLVTSYLFLAVVGLGAAGRAAAVGAWSLFCFIALLLAGGAFSMVVGPMLLRAMPVVSGSFRTMAAGTSIEGYTVPTVPIGGPVDWLTDLVPANVFGAAADGDILAVLLFTVVFSLAATRLSPAPLQALVGIARAVAEASMILVGWILIPIPLAVFALSYPLAANAGAAVVGGLLWFVLGTCAMLIVFTGLLYPLTWMVTGITPARFQRGAAPAQLVAVSTRSSLASLPAMLVSGERLGLVPSVAELVLPLSVATFKVNRTVNDPFKFLFLAHMYGIEVSTASLIAFVGLLALVSFSSPGIPNGGLFITLPYYVAAGIPVEGVVLLFAVDTIPDIFMTLTNVTADLSVGAAVSRFAGGDLANPAPLPTGAEVGPGVDGL